MIRLGTPCSRRTLSMYSCASLSPRYVAFIGMKKATFVNRSTMTHIESFPFCVLGSPTMKSMLISSHFHTGICSGWSNLASCWCSALTHRQVSHRATYSAISPFIPVHQYFCLRSMYILVDLGWMEYAEWCASSNISLRSASSWGTHIWSSYHSVPCSSTLNPRISFLLLSSLRCCISPSLS
jgi:hypothetical protein